MLTAPLRVLVVDDEPAIRDALRAVLEDLGGYAVDEAASLAEALAYLETSPGPLVALLDYLLPPDTTGPVLERLNAEPALAARVAAVAMPATPSRLTERYRALMRRLDIPLVPKPFDLDELLRAIAERAAALASRP